MAKAAVPFYRLKYPRRKYLANGDVLPLTEEDLDRMKDWKPIEKEKQDMWFESKEVVDKRNKKRDFLVTYKEAPEKTANGLFRREIEVLHVDYRGFSYSAEAGDEETLSRKFWPVVEALLAHCLSPKLRVPVNPPIPEGNDRNSEALREDALNRLFNS